MTTKVYVDAADMEKRLDEAREDIKRDYQRSSREVSGAAMGGYDTAVDVATCYPEIGGDIWHSISAVPDEGPVLLSVVNKETMECHTVFGSWTDSHFEGIGQLPDGDIAVYAWAYLPQWADNTMLDHGEDDWDGADDQAD